MSLDSLLNSGSFNLEILEEQYLKFLQDPKSIDPQWAALFQQLPVSDKSSAKIPAAPLPISTDLAAPALVPALMPDELSGRSVLYYPKVELAVEGQDYRVRDLIEAYRMYGHLAAQTNPIAMQPVEEPAELKFERYGFSKQDLSAHFPTFGLLAEEKAPLLDIINALKSTYCDRIGVEYMGLHSPELEKWIQDEVEHNRFRINLTLDQKQMILQHLNKSEIFESFIHTKYVGQKRFSLEGAETLIPMLAAIIDDGAAAGIDEYILGMAHRGRLNVLSNIFDKSYADIFSEFEEGYIPASVEGSGDVKYHKGFYSQIKTVHGHPISLTLTPNPSHLESVCPVVEGQTRARQILRGDDLEKKKILPLLIHGDAALSGQGIVYETMQFCNLQGYSTGGTLHVVINNQIGFTTIPKDSRSTFYCTDIAHIFNAPVFHVNAEDPEGCVYAAQLAVAIRQKFHCDVFVELMCYRKYGHNETDEPAFTQPLEYKIIRKKQPIRDIYRDTLIQQGLMEQHVAEDLETQFKASLQEALNAKKPAPKEKTANNAGSKSDRDKIFKHIQTGVSKEILKEIGNKICHIPETLTVHPKLAVLQKERLAMIKEGDGSRPIDWGMGELLAYGSLLWTGTNIRLSGQDSCRGTFSHRHAVLMDQVKEQGYVPLQHLRPEQGRFDVYNSPLSEFAVLGFEFGYSVASPEALVIWEAQFGDFCNGAQIIIDQYLATSEQKWGQKCGLTLLLPHGYEGQGPEHSSGRMERFLTLAGNDNLEIVNPTSPAQLFHLLRRQVLVPLRKPLVVFTPKGLLRHPACVSRLEDLTHGSFQEILDDPTPPKRAKRLALCSGRLYFDLVAERERLGNEDLAIVRIEQLYPLDTERLKELFARFSGCKECLWVQEEPSNMGAWNFIYPNLKELLPKETSLSYVGRPRSASPAVGSYSIHKQEHAAILSAIFNAKEPSIFDIAGYFKA